MFANKGIRLSVACLMMLQTISFSSSLASAANDSQATQEVVNPEEDVKKYQVETEKGLFTIEISISKKIQKKLEIKFGVKSEKKLLLVKVIIAKILCTDEMKYHVPNLP